MKIAYNKIVEIDDTKKAHEDALDLVCRCGHSLKQHSWTTAYYYPDKFHHTLYPSACVQCDCLDFRVKE